MWVLKCTGAALGKRYIEVYPVAAVARSWLGRVSPPERRRPIWEGVAPGGGGGGGWPTKIVIFVLLPFQQVAKRLCPLELYRDSVQGGVVGLKS